MRVIAGKARRLLLKTIEGQDTRPTTDRIKETLFNILNPDLPGSTFLDLFSGSGGIGIEALSRGADRAVFIEMNPKAAECIRENLQTTKLEEESIVMNCDVITGLRRVSKPGLRVYVGADELPRVLRGLGIAIISTSKGVMTDKKARELHVGGEVLAFVW